MRKLILMLAGLALLCQGANAQPAPTSAPAEAKAAPDARIQKLLDARKIVYELTRTGNFKVTFELKNGRSQIAFISSATYRYMNFDIREIVSPAYRSSEPFTAEIADRLLADNNVKKLGAWVMQKEADGYYALFVVKIPADSDDESFVNALSLALQSADDMEKELTGKDEF